MKPIAGEMTALTGAVIPVEGRKDAIRMQVQRETRSIDAEWEFRVQLCRDLDKQPVEDATVEWDEAEAPCLKVGTVRVAAQDSWDAARVKRIGRGFTPAPELYIIGYNAYQQRQPLAF